MHSHGLRQASAGSPTKGLKAARGLACRLLGQLLVDLTRFGKDWYGIQAMALACEVMSLDSSEDAAMPGSFVQGFWRPGGIPGDYQ